MNIISLLANDSYIIVNKDLIKKFGLEESIIIGDLASMYLYLKKEDRLNDDGFFFYSVEAMQENTSLTDYQQRKALEHLKNLGIVDICRREMPAKRFIKLDIESLESKILRTSSQKTKEQEVKKLENKYIDISNDISNNNIIYNNTFSKEKDICSSKKGLIEISKKPKESKPKVDKNTILAENVKKCLYKFSLNTKEIELLSKWIDELYFKGKGIGKDALSIAINHLLEISADKREDVIKRATLNAWRDFSYCLNDEPKDKLHLNKNVITDSTQREESLKEVKAKIKDGGEKDVDYY